MNARCRYSRTQKPTAGSVLRETRIRWLNASSSSRAGQRIAFGQWLYISTTPTAWPIHTMDAGALALPNVTSAKETIIRSCTREIRTLNKYMGRHDRGRHWHLKSNSCKKSSGSIPAQSDRFISSRMQGVWLETGRRERCRKQSLEQL